MSDIKATEAKLEKTSIRLEAEEDKVRDVVKERNNTVRSLESKIASQGSQIERLRQMYDNEQTRESKIEKQLEEEKNKHQEVIECLRALQSELNETKSKLQKEEGKLRDVKVERDSTVQSLESKIEKKLKEAKDEHQQIINSLKACIKTTEEKLKETRINLRLEEEKAQELMEEKETTVRSLESKNAKQGEMISNQESQIGLLRQLYKEEQTRVVSIEQQLEEEKHEHDQAKESLQTNQDICQNYRESFQEVSHFLERERQKVLELLQNSKGKNKMPPPTTAIFQELAWDKEYASISLVKVQKEIYKVESSIAFQRIQLLEKLKVLSRMEGQRESIMEDIILSDDPSSDIDAYLRAEKKGIENSHKALEDSIAALEDNQDKLKETISKQKTKLQLLEDLSSQEEARTKQLKADLAKTVDSISEEKKALQLKCNLQAEEIAYHKRKAQELEDLLLISVDS